MINLPLDVEEVADKDPMKAQETLVDSGSEVEEDEGEVEKLTPFVESPSSK